MDNSPLVFPDDFVEADTDTGFMDDTLPAAIAAISAKRVDVLLPLHRAPLAS